MNSGYTEIWPRVYWNMNSWYTEICPGVNWNMNPRGYTEIWPRVHWNMNSGYTEIWPRVYWIWIQSILESDRGYTEIWIQGILKSDRGYTEIWILEGILKYTFIEYWGFLNRNKYTEIIKIFRILKKMSKNFASGGYTEIPKLSSMSCQQHHPHACNVDFQFPMP